MPRAGQKTRRASGASERCTAPTAALKGSIVWFSEPSKRAYRIKPSERAGSDLLSDTYNVEENEFHGIHERPGGVFADIRRAYPRVSDDMTYNTGL